MDMSNFYGSEETINNDFIDTKFGEQSSFLQNLPPRISNYNQPKRRPKREAPQEKVRLPKQNKPMSQIIMQKSKHTLGLGPKLPKRKESQESLQGPEQPIKSGIGEPLTGTHTTILIKECKCANEQVCTCNKGTLEGSELPIDPNTQFKQHLRCQIDQAKKTNSFNAYFAKRAKSRGGDNRIVVPKVKRVKLLCQGATKDFSKDRPSAQKKAINWYDGKRFSYDDKALHQSQESQAFRTNTNGEGAVEPQRKGVRLSKNPGPRINQYITNLKQSRSVISVGGINEPKESEFLLNQTRLDSKDSSQENLRLRSQRGSSFFRRGDQKIYTTSMDHVKVIQSIIDKRIRTSSAAHVESDHERRQKRLGKSSQEILSYVDSENSTHLQKETSDPGDKSSAEYMRQPMQTKESHEQSLSTQPLFPKDSSAQESPRLIQIQEKNTSNLNRQSKIRKIDSVLHRLNTLLEHKSLKIEDEPPTKQLLLSQIYKEHSSLNPDYPSGGKGEESEPGTKRVETKDRLSTRQSQSSLAVTSSRQLNQTNASIKSEAVSIDKVIKEQNIRKSQLDKIFVSAKAKPMVSSAFESTMVNLASANESTDQGIRTSLRNSNDDYDPRDSFIEDVAVKREKAAQLRKMNISSQSHKRPLFQKGLKYLHSKSLKPQPEQDSMKSTTINPTLKEEGGPESCLFSHPQSKGSTRDAMYLKSTLKSGHETLQQNGSLPNIRVVSRESAGRRSRRTKLVNPLDLKRPSTSMTDIIAKKNETFPASRKTQVSRHSDKSSTKKIKSKQYQIAESSFKPPEGAAGGRRSSMKQSGLKLNYKKSGNPYSNEPLEFDESSEIFKEELRRSSKRRQSEFSHFSSQQERISTQHERNLRSQCKDLNKKGGGPFKLKEFLVEDMVATVDTQEVRPPPADYQQDEEDPELKNKLVERGSNSTLAIGLCASAIIQYIDYKNQFSGFTNRQTAIMSSDSTRLIQEAKQSVRSLNTTLNRILIKGGSAGHSVKIDTDPLNFTGVDIFQAGVPVFARIETEGRSLPVMIKIRNKEQESQMELPKNIDSQLLQLLKNEKKKYIDQMPDDLEIYISSNTPTPGPHSFETAITSQAKVNSQGVCHLKFGKEEGREEKSFPNRIYIGFVTTQRPCYIDIQLAFQKSQKQKDREKREKLLKFKKDQSGGLKMQLALLSPESRQREVNEIVRKLHMYLYEQKINEHDASGKLSRQITQNVDNFLRTVKTGRYRRMSKRRLSQAYKYEVLKATKGIDAERIMKTCEKKRLAAALGSQAMDKQTLKKAVYDESFQDYMLERQTSVNVKDILFEDDCEEKKVIEKVLKGLEDLSSEEFESSSSSSSESEDNSSAHSHDSKEKGRKKVRFQRKLMKDEYFCQLQITEESQSQNSPTKQSPPRRLEKKVSKPSIMKPLEKDTHQKQEERQKKTKEAQRIKLEGDRLKRLQTVKHLQRWDVFRQKKKEYLDFTEGLLKNWIRVRSIIAVIKAVTLVKKLYHNFQEYKEQNRIKLMKGLLAIKFKIRFRMRFQKYFGSVQSERYRRYIKRVFTVISHTAIEAKEEKSRKVVTSVIVRHATKVVLEAKMLRFYLMSMRIGRLIPPCVERKNQKRIHHLINLFEQEIEELSQVSGKYSAKFFKNNKKEFDAQSKKVDENSNLMKTVNKTARQKLFLDTFIIVQLRKILELSNLLDLMFKMHDIPKYKSIRKGLNIKAYKIREKALETLQAAMKKYKGFDNKTFWAHFLHEHKDTFIESDWTTGHYQQIELVPSSPSVKEDSTQGQVSKHLRGAASAARGGQSAFGKYKLEIAPSHEAQHQESGQSSKRHFGSGYKFPLLQRSQQAVNGVMHESKPGGILSKQMMDDSHSNFFILLQGAIQIIKHDHLGRFNHRIMQQLEMTGLTSNKIDPFEVEGMPKQFKAPKLTPLNNKIAIPRSASSMINMRSVYHGSAFNLPIQVENLDEAQREQPSKRVSDTVMGGDRCLFMTKQKRKLIETFSSSVIHTPRSQMSSGGSDSRHARQRSLAIAPGTAQPMPKPLSSSGFGKAIINLKDDDSSSSGSERGKLIMHDRCLFIPKKRQRLPKKKTVHRIEVFQDQLSVSASSLSNPMMETERHSGWPSHFKDTTEL